MTYPYPQDCICPDWDSAGKVFWPDWKSYINGDLRRIWETFAPQQKRVIAQNAQEIADRGGMVEWE